MNISLFPYFLYVVQIDLSMLPLISLVLNNLPGVYNNYTCIFVFILCRYQFIMLVYRCFSCMAPICITKLAYNNMFIAYLIDS